MEKEIVIGKDKLANTTKPIMPKGWNNPVLDAVTIDEEKKSIALSFVKKGFRRILAPFYMDKDYSIKKLGQLLQVMEIEIEGEDITLSELKDILDEYVGQEIKYICVKHRRIINKNTGNPQVVAAYWYSSNEKHEYDSAKAFVDDTKK